VDPQIEPRFNGYRQLEGWSAGVTLAVGQFGAVGFEVSGSDLLVESISLEMTGGAAGGILRLAVGARPDLTQTLVGTPDTKAIRYSPGVAPPGLDPWFRIQATQGLPLGMRVVAGSTDQYQQPLLTPGLIVPQGQNLWVQDDDSTGQTFTATVFYRRADYQ
jgi:hypothetical protein